MSDHSRRVCYDIGRIMVDAAKEATLKVISDYKEMYPDKKFNLEELLCDLNDADNELIEFLHDLALELHPEKHISVTASITGKSTATIDRRVN